MFNVLSLACIVFRFLAGLLVHVLPLGILATLDDNVETSDTSGPLKLLGPQVRGRLPETLLGTENQFCEYPSPLKGLIEKKYMQDILDI